jgi:hypothetical protein
MTEFPYSVYYGMAAKQVRETDPIKRHLTIVAAMKK